jgi:hypothetical protein
MRSLLAASSLVVMLTACTASTGRTLLESGGEGNLLPGDGRSGIEGVVLLGPACPVERIDDPCPDKPIQATVAVKRNEQLVARFSSDDQGKFRVTLEAGTYRLESVAVLPRGIPSTVTVSAGQFRKIVVQYDSGIR